MTATKGLPDGVLIQARTVEDAAHLAQRKADPDTIMGGAQHMNVPVRLVDAASLEDLLALARSKAMDPSVFEEHPPVFFTAHASNNKPDAYDTRMHESSLKNYAADATDPGVAFMTSHEHRAIPAGRTIMGRFTRGANARTEVDYYIPSGLSYIGAGGNPVNTDMVIAPIRAGTLSDVSIGFAGGTYRCSICGLDPFDWFSECRHWPGVEYPIIDSKGNETGRQIAYAWIHDAHLSELSGVFDGATPGAMILALRMLRELEAGRMSPDAARVMEAKYRIKVIGAGRAFPAAGSQEDDMTAKPTAKRTEPVEDQTETPAPTEDDEDDEATEATEAAEESASETADDESDATADEGEQGEQGGEQRGRVLAIGGASVRSIMTILVRVGVPDEHAQDVGSGIDWLASEVERLRAVEADGNAYRADLIAQCLREGARAFGEKFNPEQRRAKLDKLPIEDIREYLDSWSEIAAKRFPGGRQSADQDDNTDGVPAREPGSLATLVATTPNGAYRA